LIDSKRGKWGIKIGDGIIQEMSQLLLSDVREKRSEQILLSACERFNVINNTAAAGSSALVTIAFFNFEPRQPGSGEISIPQQQLKKLPVLPRLNGPVPMPSGAWGHFRSYP
jgi:hypothetical protein